MNPSADELGLYVCGGRGRQSRRTPDELRALADRIGLDGDALVRTSRLTARVDNNAVDDGFQIYLHSFVLAADGEWAVVQQGMNEASRLARRYHWHSPAVRDFVADPTRRSSASPRARFATWSTDVPARRSRRCSPSRARSRRARSPRCAGCRCPPTTTSAPATCTSGGSVRCWRWPTSVSCGTSGRSCCSSSSGRARLQSSGARRRGGARSARPVRGPGAGFSFAHGGKDGHPFPVPLTVYDDSISVLRRALDAAAVGHTEKLDGSSGSTPSRAPSNMGRQPVADVAATIAHERAISRGLGGRTVFDDRRRRPQRPPKASSIFSQARGQA
jgi:hypothetical protein